MHSLPQFLSRFSRSVSRELLKRPKTIVGLSYSFSLGLCFREAPLCHPVHRQTCSKSLCDTYPISMWRDLTHPALNAEMPTSRLPARCREACRAEQFSWFSRSPRPVGPSLPDLNGPGWRALQIPT